MKQKLIKFTSWNLFSLISIFLISFISIPLYINNLISENFAILSLIWSTLSVSSILDFGLGRSLIRELSVLINENKKDHLRSYISTGFITAVFFATIAGFLAYTILSLYFRLVSNKLTLDNYTILYISLSVTFTIINNALLSIFEGTHLINVSSILKVVFSFFFFAFPALLVYLHYIEGLSQIIIIILFSKISQTIVSFIFVQRYHPFSIFLFSFLHFSKFVKLGKWLTLSNLVSVLMTHSDRFIIGYYSLPFKLVNYSVASDLIQKGSSIFSIFPTSIYPLIAHTDKKIYSLKKMKFILILMSIIVIAAIGFSFIIIDKILIIWLKDAYNPEITLLFKIMSFVWIATGFGQLFLTRLHSLGETKLPALLNLFESFLFIPAMILSIKFYGIIAAAIVMLMRSFIDASILFLITKRYE
jgi:O-antigen/teichoic acid export membrane protein